MRLAHTPHLNRAKEDPSKKQAKKHGTAPIDAIESDY
jgi:hypothetical protein